MISHWQTQSINAQRCAWNDIGEITHSPTLPPPNRNEKRRKRNAARLGFEIGNNIVVTFYSWLVNIAWVAMDAQYNTRQMQTTDHLFDQKFWKLIIA